MPGNPWNSVEQHPDDERAGSPWFFAETYQEFHWGLESLLGELEQHRKAVEQLGLTASPFEEEVDYLRGMVAWGQGKARCLRKLAPGNYYRQRRDLQVIAISQGRRSVSGI